MLKLSTFLNFSKIGQLQVTQLKNYCRENVIKWALSLSKIHSFAI